MTDPKQLRIADFDYLLPEERIARFPASERQGSRLLRYHDGLITEHLYADLPQLLPHNSLIVCNDSKVEEARLIFHKSSGGKIELFCLEPGPAFREVTEGLRQTGTVDYYCLIGGASKWKHGEILTLKEQSGTEELSLQARIIARENNRFLIRFEWRPEQWNFAEVLHAAGKIPLPPYLKRDAEATDRDRYQTVYASREGSVAAPTAGLHFTPALLDQLRKQGILPAFLTLHVGAGTFKPVQSESMDGHEMHREWIDVSIDLLKTLCDYSKEMITAVGTTSLRTLESVYWMGVKAKDDPSIEPEQLSMTQWEPYRRKGPPVSRETALEALLKWMEKRKETRLLTTTQLLIAPGYTIQMAGRLITNFHQPRSTLLLLMAAFTGHEWKKIYQYALDNGFRFLSYGDGCLLEPSMPG